MSNKLRVVHYLNQFFGQIGSEESADISPQEYTGAIGPAIAVNKELDNKGEVVATVICGDNYFAENIEIAGNIILSMIKKYSPDIVIAGPAFNAGRYGLACGDICKRVKSELGIPAITAMYKENPGVELYKKDVIIARTGDTATSMKTAIKDMINIGLKLIEGNTLAPNADNYFPQGYKRNIILDKTGAQRAVDMLLAKINGDEFISEVRLPEFDRVPEAPSITDLSKSIIALVTDGGLYPAGNPDKIESASATKYGKYLIKDKDELKREDYEVHHRGYNKYYIEEDPNRLVPVDVMREIEKEGRIGSLFPYYFSTTGVVTTLDNARKIGKNIARELKEAGVNAVILTST